MKPEGHVPTGDKDLFDHAVEGNVFMTTTGSISAGTGDAIRVTLDNPVASGRVYTVFRLVSYVDSGPLFPGVYINPTNGLPSTENNVTNANHGSSNTSDAVSKADAGGTSLGGGNDTGVDFAIDNGINEREIIQVIYPGQTIGMNIALGSLSSGEGSLSAWWIETEI